MRSTIFGLSALAIAAVSAPALAEDLGGGFTVTGGATITSDYRFRGVSQTNREPAIQGTIGISHSSGFYIGTWGSSVDSNVYAGSSQEIDLYGGWTGAVGPVTIDAGVLYYYYPGADELVFPTDFFEPYASVKGTFGPVTAKVGVAFAPDQKPLAKDNLYGYGELSAAIPNTPFTLKGHVGYTQNGFAGGPDYTDWSLGVDATYKSLTLNVSYVDTDLSKALYGHNIEAGPTVSLSVAF